MSVANYYICSWVTLGPTGDKFKWAKELLQILYHWLQWRHCMWVLRFHPLCSYCGPLVACCAIFPGWYWFPLAIIWTCPCITRSWASIQVNLRLKSENAFAQMLHANIRHTNATIRQHEITTHFCKRLVNYIYWSSLDFDPERTVDRTVRVTSWGKSSPKFCSSIRETGIIL